MVCIVMEATLIWPQGNKFIEIESLQYWMTLIPMELELGRAGEWVGALSQECAQDVKISKRLSNVGSTPRLTFPTIFL